MKTNLATNNVLYEINTNRSIKTAIREVVRDTKFDTGLREDKDILDALAENLRNMFAESCGDVKVDYSEFRSLVDNFITDAIDSVNWVEVAKYVLKARRK